MVGSLSDWLDRRNNEFFHEERYEQLNPKIRVDGDIARGLSWLDFYKVVRYFTEIANAVEYYQRIDYFDTTGTKKEGVIHRDLKPRNILYDSNRDTFLISDFGLAGMYTDIVL